MLSRIALRSVQEGKPCLAALTRSSTSVAAGSDSKNEVTFERRKRPIHPGKVRMGFVPEEWFQFLYPKTGVTGPYVLGASFLTYLLSKEILVLEHEAFTGMSLAMMTIYGIKKFGPQVAESLDKEVEAVVSEYHNYREVSIDNLKKSIEDEKHSQWQAQGQTLLFDAKRENIGLQLEAAYRERLSQVYSQVNSLCFF
ncbi:UNVERIFIED_CONTAM: hypothetical protein GTU68_009123 [Idotea baltica]|nr:hypothetical protein [Idotea baltica]